jgi:uncharacterized membrane protein
MSNRSGNNTTALVKGLGGASLGLGLSELLAPAKVAALAGIADTSRTRPVIRALGLRECGHAAALLFGPDRMVWTRVAGDALDLALLGAALAKHGAGRRGRGAVSVAALLGIAATDVYAARRCTRTGGGRHGRKPAGSPDRTLRAAVTVWRPPEHVYRLWRDSHDDVQITEDTPTTRIAWEPSPGSAIGYCGSVEFTATPADDGTEVRVTVGYHQPGGILGKAVATLSGTSAEQQVNDDLRRFKQIVETGQSMRSGGSPEGTAAGRQMHQKAAQPEGRGR